MLRTFCSPLFSAFPDFNRLVALTMNIVLLTRETYKMLVSTCFDRRGGTNRKASSRRTSFCVFDRSYNPFLTVPSLALPKLWENEVGVFAAYHAHVGSVQAL
jgi:hypothetical protein